jgi:hypothetical protein
VRRIDCAIKAGLAAGLSLAALTPAAASTILHTTLAYVRSARDAGGRVYLDRRRVQLGDAGIGAAGGFGLAMLVCGGLVVGPASLMSRHDSDSADMALRPTRKPKEQERPDRRFATLLHSRPRGHLERLRCPRNPHQSKR